MILLSFWNVSLLRTYICGPRNIFYSWERTRTLLQSGDKFDEFLCYFWSGNLAKNIFLSNSNVKNYDTLPRDRFKIAMAQNYGRQRTMNQVFHEVLWGLANLELLFLAKNGRGKLSLVSSLLLLEVILRCFARRWLQAFFLRFIIFNPYCEEDSEDSHFWLYTILLVVMWCTYLGGPHLQPIFDCFKAVLPSPKPTFWSQ